MDEDFIDELMDDENEGQQLEETQNSDDIIDDHQQEDNSYNEVGDDDSFISDLLRSRGIEDLSKIKFENDEGEIEEVDWNTLSKEDKLNIFNSSAQNPDTDLDEDEINLINAVRRSKLSPVEYLQYIQQESVNRYIQNSQLNEHTYTIDQYSNEDLYIYDLISRTGITLEEATEQLTQAKSNPDLFEKQIGAIRDEYKEVEREQLQNAEFEEKQLAQEQYKQFAQNIANEISEFKEFSGYTIDMNNEDMQEIYEFITGTDAAGNNHFSKALADPKTLVQIAYMALNGQRLVNDITDYFQKEISKVRKESYNQGLNASKNKDNQKVIYKNKQISHLDHLDDLDDF